MKKIIHTANSRGHADYGWLNTYHTFSFANYYNPERMNFGVLRVLNDDEVSGGRGFSAHPHTNMEIISIPLEGELRHKDSMGNVSFIKAGDIQVMSAGTGITHSEFNHNTTEKVKFLQIWIIPDKQNVRPRYDQIALNSIAKENAFYQVLSPNPDDQGVWIYQAAWANLGKFETGQKATYELHKNSNGVYIFIISGKVKIGQDELETRDGCGVWDTTTIDFSFRTDTYLLVLEVPLEV